MKLTRQYRKLKNIYLKVAVAACLFIIFVIPFATRFTTPQTVEADSRAVNGTAGYTVVLNGTPIGCTQDEETARTALQNAEIYFFAALEHIQVENNICGRHYL